MYAINITQSLKDSKTQRELPYTKNLEYAYIYGDSRRLYLNATNRCTNRCAFCVRYRTDGLGGAILWGGVEPDLGQLQAAVQAGSNYRSVREFIWCGYGEPTFRLDLILQAASWLKSNGARIRLNTNGHANLIHNRDVLVELSRAVDEVSISLNAPNPERYAELCRPDPETFPYPAGTAIPARLAWEATLDFISRAPAYFQSVQASVVGFALTADEIESCRQLARSLGVTQFRVR
jgi:TatD DNase family protein